jgi:cysteine desulfurase / selenocysteine lyase
VSLEARRADFPALRPRPGPPRVYLDSACMTLVPEAVLDAMEAYYREYPGCAGRSLHRFAEEVSRRFEGARGALGRYLGRRDPAGVVFLRNATEAINVVAEGLPWKRGDRVVITDREHNSNLVVWQRLARERGIEIEVLRLPDDGTFDPEALDAALTRGARLVSVFHTSNLDGRTLPVREIAERAHDGGASLLVDGCQAASHRPVDVERLGIDYYAVSAHKMLGPTGVGALLAPPELLRGLRPLLLGGETVTRTTLRDHELKDVPHRLEAGLQNYAGVLGWAAAIDYLSRLDLGEVEAAERRVNELITDRFRGEPRVHLLGSLDPTARPSLVAFTIDGVDPHDAAVFLDEGYGVMVRSGMHCVHSFYAERNLSGNVRASFHLYTTVDDGRALVDGVDELLARLAPGTVSGTSGAKGRSPALRRPAPPRGAGSTGAAARSAPPPRRAERGRAGSSRGSG